MIRARDLLHPKVVLPVLLAGALLAFAVMLGGLESLGARIAGIPWRVLAMAVALAAVYLVLKALQLWMLVARLGLRVPAPDLALAFCVGELTLTLPFGLFSQNWVMSLRRIRVARSAGATVMMLFAETFVALLALAAIGIPGWSALGPAAAGVALACAITVLWLLRHDRLPTRVAASVRQPLLRKTLRAGAELLHSLKGLSRPDVVAANVLLAAAYLAVLALAFLVVAHGLGVRALDYRRAVTIYAFALVVVLLGAGALGQVGTVDVLGMMAARSWGIGYAEGLAMMLGFRVVWTGAMWLVNLPAVVLLHARIGGGRRGARMSAHERQKAFD